MWSWIFSEMSIVGNSLEEFKCCANDVIHFKLGKYYNTIQNKQYSVQYNITIAKCQYKCTRNVLQCQVHSLHIHANHKTLNYNNSKQTSPGEKSFINNEKAHWHHAVHITYKLPLHDVPLLKITVLKAIIIMKIISNKLINLACLPCCPLSVYQPVFLLRWSTWGSHSSESVKHWKLFGPSLVLV